MSTPLDPSGGRLRGRIMMGVGFGALVYLAFSIWAEPRELRASLAGFAWSAFVFALLLALANYALRFAKWHYYLHRLGVRLRVRRSAVVFLCGLVMSVTPGKLGELLKPYLVHGINGTPIERTVPVVLTERLTDLISVLLLTAVGVHLLGLDSRVAWVSAGLVVLLVAVVCCRPLFVGLARLASRARRLEPLAQRALIAHGSMVELVQPRPLLVGTALSVPAWFLECVAFHLVLKGFGQSSDLLRATAVYAFATLAGAITMLPGGLGATEVSMAALLERSLGIPSASAAAATLIVRAATLWFAVALGALTMVAGRRHLLPIEGEEPSALGR